MTKDKYLLLEPENENLSRAGEILGSLGIHADRPSTRDEAVRLIKSGKYNCILIGHETTDEWSMALKNLSALAHSSTFILTGPDDRPACTAGDVTAADGSYPCTVSGIRKLTEHVRHAFSETAAEGFYATSLLTGQLESRSLIGRDNGRYTCEGITILHDRISGTGPDEDIVIALERNEHEYGFFLGDISASPSTSELLKLHLTPFIESALVESPNPGDVLSTINHEFLKSGFNADYMTGFAMFINPARLTSEYSGGGHPPALHRRWGSRTWRELESTGSPLGIKHDQVWDSTCMRFDSGDKVLGLSDGITRLDGCTGKSNNIGMVLEAITMIPGDTAPHEIVESIGDYVKRNVGNEIPQDEVSVLLIQL